MSFSRWHGHCKPGVSSLLQQGLRIGRLLWMPQRPIGGRPTCPCQVFGLAPLLSLGRGSLLFPLLSFCQNILHIRNQVNGYCFTGWCRCQNTSQDNQRLGFLFASSPFPTPIPKSHLLCPTSDKCDAVLCYVLETNTYLSLPKLKEFISSRLNYRKY